MDGDNMKRMGGTCFHICTHEAVGLTVSNRTSYERLKAAVLEAGRFSVFEATANRYAAALYTRLCSDPAIVTDISCGYPWTTVRRK